MTILIRLALVQVLEWQPGANRILSVPYGAAVEVLNSWEGECAFLDLPLPPVVPRRSRYKQVTLSERTFNRSFGALVGR